MLDSLHPIINYLQSFVQLNLKRLQQLRDQLSINYYSLTFVYSIYLCYFPQCLVTVAYYCTPPSQLTVLYVLCWACFPLDFPVTV